MYEICVIMKKQILNAKVYVEDMGVAFSIARLLSFDENILAVIVEDDSGKILLEI